MNYPIGIAVGMASNNSQSISSSLIVAMAISLVILGIIVWKMLN